MNNNTNKRRQFIQYGVGISASVGLLASGWWWAKQNHAATIIQSTGLGPEAEQVLASMHGSSAVGEWVIAEHRAFQQPLAALVDQLRQRLRLSATEQPGGESFIQALQLAIAKDFSNAEVLLAKDWQLAYTEALISVIRLHAVGRTANEQDNGKPVEADIAEVTNWGPKHTGVGQPANEQSGGYSALWFDIETVPRWAQIAIDGQRLETLHREGVLVAVIKGALQDAVLAEPSQHLITLHDDMSNTWQEIGHFTVKPGKNGQAHSGSKENQLTKPNKQGAICTVSQWGPQSTTAGIAANPQKDGDMGIWLDTACAPRHVGVRFGDQLLDGYFNGRVVTTLVPPALFQKKGRFSVSLVDPDSQEEQYVGEFVVN